MSERFADLSRIIFSEYEDIGKLAIFFFSPLQNKKLREEMGVSSEGPIHPFSTNDFYMFMTKIDKDYEKKIYKIKKVLSLMEQASILTYEGQSSSAMMGKCYYAFKELSELQSRNLLWLGEAFGFPYLHNKICANVVHITGHARNGRIGNGTGFLINDNTVLTCRHVVTEMTPDEKLLIEGKEYAYSVQTHKQYDIALLVLNGTVDSVKTFPAFSDARTLDEVIIMGYPPIPGSDNDYLLSQKGEVNSIVYDYLSGTNNLVLSSITRPGSSGGPVISKTGYIVGMVTKINYYGKDAEAFKDINGKNMFPFYMAMQGEDLYNGIKEIDPDAVVFFEDYH